MFRFRYLLVPAIIVLLISSCATYKQNSNEEYPDGLSIEKTVNGNYEYQEIFKVDSTSKKEIYTRLNQWVAKNYVSASDVIQYQDENAGKIESVN